MKINISFLSLLFLFFIPSIYIAQDCACKYWKKTYYDSNGKVNYEYQHGCQQPSFAYEYIGYDNDYCNELAEKQKRKIISQKNFNEANKILNDTKKILEKDGFKVISWWGKQLGNTEYWGLVGKPRCGIKADSTIISWNEDSSIRFEGKIKNGRLDGLIKFNVGPFYDLVKIGEHLNLYISNTEPSFIYYNEKETFDDFKTALKQRKVQRIIAGDNSYEYKDENGNWNQCYYYLFSNNSTIMFTKPVDETKAKEIEEFISKSLIKKSKDSITQYKNKLENFIRNVNLVEEKYTKYKNHELNSIEKSLVGKWEFNTNEKWDKSSGQLQLNETYDFKEDNSFTYSFNFKNYNTIFYKILKEGYWYLKDNKVFMVLKEDDIYNTEEVKKAKDNTPYFIDLLNKAIIEEKKLLFFDKSNDDNVFDSIINNPNLNDLNKSFKYNYNYTIDKFMENYPYNHSTVEAPFNFLGQKKILKENYFIRDSLCFLLYKNEYELRGIFDNYPATFNFEILQGKKYNK